MICIFNAESTQSRPCSECFICKTSTNIFTLLHFQFYVTNVTSYTIRFSSNIILNISEMYDNIYMLDIFNTGNAGSTCAQSALLMVLNGHYCHQHIARFRLRGFYCIIVVTCVCGFIGIWCIIVMLFVLWIILNQTSIWYLQLHFHPMIAEICSCVILNYLTTNIAIQRSWNFWPG